jgi:hypothetical protein
MAHFPQAALGSLANAVTLRAQLDHGGVLDEDLPPDLDQYLLEGMGSLF